MPIPSTRSTTKPSWPCPKVQAQAHVQVPHFLKGTLFEILKMIIEGDFLIMTLQQLEDNFQHRTYEFEHLAEHSGSEY